MNGRSTDGMNMCICVMVHTQILHQIMDKLERESVLVNVLYVTVYIDVRIHRLQMQSVDGILHELRLV